MSRRALIALGIGQCVNWGILYYAFAVLVLPLERELAVQTWVVTGAFSVALLTSAALAPAVGRWSDQDRGATLMQLGGISAAALLVAWTLTHGVLALYVVWGLLGLCMATTLYEPAFNIIGRAYEHPAKRLRAIAAVTIFGGLASTVFLPLTAGLLDAFGWRAAVLVLAGLIAASTGLLRTFVFRQLSTTSTTGFVTSPCGSNSGFRPPHFWLIAATFALASLASAAFTANLVPALGERGLSPQHAALLGGVMGLMQLPGRALLMNGAFAASPWTLLTGSLALHALGLASIALVPSTTAVVAGAMVFALGAGLTTLVRPHLVQTLFSSGVGHLNGRIARQQQLARALGPLAVAWAASNVSYANVFVLMGVTFVLTALVWTALAGATSAFGTRKEVA